jgi:hypothetical protein
VVSSRTSVAANDDGKSPKSSTDDDDGKSPKSSTDDDNGKSPKSSTDDDGGESPKSSTDDDGGKSPKSSTDDNGGKSPKSSTDDDGGKSPKSTTDDDDGKSPKSPADDNDATLTDDDAFALAPADDGDDDAGGPAHRNATRHIVFIYVDDQGYNDLGAASTDLSDLTPNIMTLADSGVWLGRYYGMYLCTPRYRHDVPHHHKEWLPGRLESPPHAPATCTSARRAAPRS